MSISREEVQHIAALCRIGMTEEDLERFPEQLSHILEMFEVLQEMDTDDVPPTGHSVTSGTVWREDESRPSSPIEESLSNAPLREGDLIRVKAVLGE